MINTCLINLENYTLEDYQDMEDFIQETFVEKEEINKMLEEFKKVVDALDSDITTFDREKIEKLLDSIDKTASKVNTHNKNVYRTVKYISTFIQFIEIIISICNFVKSMKAMNDEKDARVQDALNKLTPEERDALKKNKKAFMKFYKQNSKDPRSLKDKITGSIIDDIKEFFTVKGLVKKALSTLNKFLGTKAKEYLKYETEADKGYELLLNCEAKMMVEKRKARKMNDKEAEENCDLVIEFVENLKKERVKKKEEARRAQYESASIQESERSEFKINNFKLVCRDLAEGLNIEKANLRKYCDTAIYVVRRALETTDENKELKLELMEKKLKEAQDYVDSLDRAYDRKTLMTLFKKYSSMFSVKYSKFGIKAKDKFEAQLANIGKEIKDIVENYYKTLASIIGSSSSVDIKDVMNELEHKVNCSSTTLSGIKRIIKELDDSSSVTIDVCNGFINWCLKNLEITGIKEKLKFKIFSKILG